MHLKTCILIWGKAALGRRVCSLRSFKRRGLRPKIHYEELFELVNERVGAAKVPLGSQFYQKHGRIRHCEDFTVTVPQQLSQVSIVHPDVSEQRSPGGC